VGQPIGVFRLSSTRGRSLAQLRCSHNAVPMHSSSPPTRFGQPSRDVGELNGSLCGSRNFPVARICSGWRSRQLWNEPCRCPSATGQLHWQDLQGATPADLPVVQPTSRPPRARARGGLQSFAQLFRCKFRREKSLSDASSTSSKNVYLLWRA
jgi:hypothetical protein